MAPLVKGEWAEVRTLAIGEVSPVLKKGEREVQTQALSYLLRLTDAERFSRLALVEAQRLGGGDSSKGGRCERWGGMGPTFY
jgi:hypothetical protein